MKKIIALIMALMMLTGMVSAMAEEAPVYQYTYNTYMGADPLNWNPHAWEMSNESDLMAWIEAPLVDTNIAADGVNFEWIYELATAVTDVTADFADKEAWGIPADATENYVYTIDLRPEAKWEDGTPINADTYIYSMQQLLDPAMKNYRSNSYYGSSSMAIKNAEAYFNGDKVGQEYTATLKALGFGSVEEAKEAGYDKVFVDVKGFWGVAKEDGTTVISIEDEELIRDPAVEEGQDEDFVSAKYLFETYLATGQQYAGYQPDYVHVVAGVYEEMPWEKVGLLKTGDYQLTYILENGQTMFYVLSGLTSNWIVKEDLYEANKEVKEQLVATKYGTAIENYSSTGPYKIDSFEKGKQMVLVKNENWFGYTDPAHEGHYMADRIVIDIIGEQATALMLFQQGKLDSVELTSDDMTKYRMSDYLLKTDQTYTFRYIFATDPVALAALEDEANDGANKKVLQYDDFRKAISLAMNRATFCEQATPAYKPAYYLFNYLYYYDIEHNTESQYRNTDEAKQAVLNLYGMEYGEGKEYADIDTAFAAVTGYDVEEARQLFQSVYERALVEGTYTEGQAININCMCSAAATMTPDDTRQMELLNDMVGEATKGTGFEGKITFKFMSGSTTRYDDVAGGRIEMIRGAWGGAAFYPFSTIRVYCEPEYMGGLALIHESCGWDPSVEKLDVTIDGETITDTFQNWAKSINGAGKYVSEPEKCLAILSALETGVLGAYQCIPWGSEVNCSMFSQKIEYATLDYNIMYGYGGTRLMKFNYTDTEWAEYVSSLGGVLDYE